MDITLKAPRLIDGAIRYPAEGPIQIDDAIAAQLIDEDLAVAVDRNAADLHAMSVKDLRAFAASKEIAVGDAKGKPELIAAISAALDG